MSNNEEYNYCIPTTWIGKDGVMNKGLWYFYHLRMKERIKNYQNAWSHIVANKKNLSNYPRIEEHYVSISEQYCYVLFNLDQIIKIERKQYPDNDDVFFMTYFTYNFILSTKSVLDIFAWLIYDIFACNCEPFEVSLFFKNYHKAKEKHKEFKKQLCAKSGLKFYKYICSDKVQTVLAILEQHRDIVCHKGKIHIMVHENKDVDQSTIMKPVEPYISIDKNFATLRYEKCSVFSETTLLTLDSIFDHVNNLYKEECTRLLKS